MQIKKSEGEYMKKNNIDPIPHFTSYKEEAEFWDRHSLADYWDTWEDVDIVFDLDKPREESLILRLQKSFKRALAKTAMRKGLNVSTLARMWLMEKLQEDARAGRAAKKTGNVEEMCGSLKTSVGYVPHDKARKIAARALAKQYS